MLSVILKNALLVFLIVLIIHFMIQNQLLENKETMRRKQIHRATENKATIPPPSPKKVEEETVVVNCPKKKVRFAEKECSGSLTCDDFDVPEGVVEKEERMKELYDFVFDSDPTNMDTYFPKTTEEIKTDKTELDLHKIHENTPDNLECNFEIIGIIETDETDIGGVDTTSSSYLSKII